MHEIISLFDEPYFSYFCIMFWLIISSFDRETISPVAGALPAMVILMAFHSSIAQKLLPHKEAHAHNDYEHTHPLKDALAFGFMSVEADVHLLSGVLRIGHDRVSGTSPELEKLYLKPVDSILRVHGGSIYSTYVRPFYLLVDIKTDAAGTFQVLHALVTKYPTLLCMSDSCPVKIVISGNRPMDLLQSAGYQGLGIDGRPSDLGRLYSRQFMPIVSDNYNNWASWDGKTVAVQGDMTRIRELADRVHAEGKILRLWAIPDNELAWKTLLEVGVDLINTDRLEELHTYLIDHGGR